MTFYEQVECPCSIPCITKEATPTVETGFDRDLHRKVGRIPSLHRKVGKETEFALQSGQYSGPPCHYANSLARMPA
jgi:hypothetical protein